MISSTRELSQALAKIPSKRWLRLTPKIMNLVTTISGTIISFVFFWDMLMRFCPHVLRLYLKRYTTRFSALLNPYVQISIHQYLGSHGTNHSHRAYAIVEAYLSAKSLNHAKRFKAEMSTEKLMLSMDEYEKTTDYFNGVEIEWFSGKSTSPQRETVFSSVPDRYYRLKFHKRYKEMITGAYLEHVMEMGREMQIKNRQRKLYTNSSNIRFCCWSHVVFEHPGRFENLAMESEKKKEIVEDLLTFAKSKDYYARIGKAWKRGYLLYGPPGTGKTTLIAAMANLLDYDVYDLELTSVEDNTQLRKLLTETTAKSILVIEDVDCSLHLTGQRKKKTVQEKSEKEKKKTEKDSGSGGKLTLSGLLNSIDGLWSACAGERLIVFTTNYVEKLDPALTRRGRMDKHIELSYCKFQGFKVLAKNYLELDEHPLFGSVEELIEEVEITPADVAENLIPKSEEGGAEECLVNLIATLEKAKVRKMKKMEEATKKKMEEETKKKMEEMGEVDVSKSNEDVDADAQEEKVVVELETL